MSTQCTATQLALQSFGRRQDNAQAETNSVDTPKFDTELHLLSR